ncbi:MAG: DUF721 domain-containing protein [Candidatus Omnitrophica bacterium]|jgi:hypothetical protein|nr:DUF721 domain-containing protein [Candidatus Omnitrophota bacterium]
MERIDKTINAVLENLQNPKGKAAIDGPQEILKKILAKKACEHVQLYAFKNGTLFVKVDSASWLYYLKLEKDNLLAKIQKVMKEAKEIRFSLGE